MKEKGSRDPNPKPNRLNYTSKKPKEQFTLHLSDSFNIIHKIKHNRFLVYSSSDEIALKGLINGMKFNDTDFSFKMIW